MFLWVRALLAVVALGWAMGLSATLAGQTGASASKGDAEWRFFGGVAAAAAGSDSVRLTPRV